MAQRKLFAIPLSRWSVHTFGVYLVPKRRTRSSLEQARAAGWYHDPSKLSLAERRSNGPSWSFAGGRAFPQFGLARLPSLRRGPGGQGGPF